MGLLRSKGDDDIISADEDSNKPPLNSMELKVHVYVCMYVCMHVCMYVRMHACMHAYILLTLNLVTTLGWL